jgi:hypothetical protein
MKMMLVNNCHKKNWINNRQPARKRGSSGDKNIRGKNGRLLFCPAFPAALLGVLFGCMRTNRDSGDVIGDLKVMDIERAQARPDQIYIPDGSRSSLKMRSSSWEGGSVDGKSGMVFISQPVFSLTCSTVLPGWRAVTTSSP